MRGILVLEDGRFFVGRRFGGEADGAGEVVFNTSFTGYQEILTDPSYAGQVVVLTSPHIGNYGVNRSDVESVAVRAGGLVVRDEHPVPSSWRAQRSLGSWLTECRVPALSRIDTRALVVHLREHGALRGVIRRLDSAPADLPRAGTDHPALRDLVGQARAVPSLVGRDLAGRVTCGEPWTAGPDTADLHVVVCDFGVKHSIVRQLVASGCRVTVLPATTGAAAILERRPDGVLLSNGPGDPEPVSYAVETVRALLGRVPLFGICLGHQLLALALGARTWKLKYGHRGSNHPVRNLATGRIEITAQNHGFSVDAGSLDGHQVQVTHLHLNDDTVAGLRHRHLPAFSVQFHPEASPGPHDSHHLFSQFVDEMTRQRRTRR